MTDGAFYAVPTRRRRFWRALGFRYHLGDDPKGAEEMLGWMCTESRFAFSMADRFRLLLTGRLDVRIVHHTTVQVNESKNRVDWQIKAHGRPSTPRRRIGKARAGHLLDGREHFAWPQSARAEVPA